MSFLEPRFMSYVIFGTMCGRVRWRHRKDHTVLNNCEYQRVYIWHEKRSKIRSKMKAKTWASKWQTLGKPWASPPKKWASSLFVWKSVLVFVGRASKGIAPSHLFIILLLWNQYGGRVLVACGGYRMSGVDGCVGGGCRWFCCQDVTQMAPL